jgi:signal transduction histidine kinase
MDFFRHVYVKDIQENQELRNKASREFSSFYLQRTMYFAVVTIVVTILLIVVDLFIFGGGRFPDNLLLKDWISIGFAFIALLLFFVTLRIYKSGVANTLAGPVLGTVFITFLLVEGILLLLIATTIPMPEIYLVMIFLAIAGGIPLPPVYFHPLVMVGVIFSTVVLYLTRGTGESPALSTIIIGSSGILSAVISYSNYNHLRGMIMNRLWIEDLNGQQKQFLSILAHDLRNPIGTMPRMIDLILEESPETIRRDLEVVGLTAHSTYNLLENLLTWGRERQHSLTADLKPVDLTGIIDSVVESLESQARFKGITLAVNDGICPAVISDPDHLQTVLRNIINNAIKFTPSGSSIHISLFSDPDNDVGTIRVRDEGMGMKDNEVKTLLEGKPGEKRNGTEGESGKGLGMVLVWELCRLIDAEISISSNPGAGTTMDISLPFS